MPERSASAHKEVPQRLSIEVEKPAKPTWFNLVLIIAAVLVAVAYWNAPQNGFVYDDQWQIVRNPLIQQPGLWGKALTSDVWAFRTGDETAVSNYYRPVFTAWSIANFTLFKLEPAGWHVTNVLLHLAAVWLVLLALFRLGFHPAVCAGATWIFAAHPVHVENVTWIAGAPDLLMTVFLMLSQLAYLRVREAPTAKHWLFALGAMFLAMGSKESAMMFVLVVFATELALSKTEGRDGGMPRAVRAAIAYGVVAALFFVVRTLAIGQSLLGSQSEASLGTILLTIPQILTFYLVQAVFPATLSSAYPLRAVEGGLNAQNFFVPLLVTVALLAAAIWLIKKYPKLGIAFATILILAPSLYFKVFHYEHIVRDRYIYLPLLGILLFIFVPLVKSEPDGAFKWNPLTIGALGVSIAFAYLSMQYNSVWKSDVDLWRRGVETDPNGSLANMQLAESLRMDGRAEEGLPYAKKAVELAKHKSKSLNVLGLCYKDLGDFPNAISTFQRVIDMGVETNLAAGNLADIYAKQGNFDDAVKVFEAEVARHPGYEPLGKQNIAVLLVREGKRKEAIEVLQSSLESAKKNALPNVKRNWFMLAELYHEEGDNAKAAENYREYLNQTAGMGDPPTLENRRRAEQMLKDIGG